ncbi:MAG: nicotinate-nucleotide adenylyltransferase [Clostridia bacterium]|nr:nicotinate-nucleotide adenylyltransferase [Clostridia bacterium]
MSKIGILGGTFDPIHNGHIFLAETVLRICGLDKIMFLPLNVPPHKKTPVASVIQRCRMIEKSIEGNDSFFISYREIERTGVTYTFETLKEFAKTNPDGELFYIIGTDTLLELENWRNIEMVLNLCTFICMARPLEKKAIQEEYVNKIKKKYGKDILLVPVEGKNISSTMVRNASKDELKELVPPSILDLVINIYAKDD